jgi:hypothetical protein
LPYHEIQQTAPHTFQKLRNQEKFAFQEELTAKAAKDSTQ